MNLKPLRKSQKLNNTMGITGINQIFKYHNKWKICNLWWYIKEEKEFIITYG